MDISGIMGQVRAGGFMNPMSSHLNSALTKIKPPSLAELTTMANEQYTLAGLGVPDSGQIQSAVNSMNKAFDATQNMLGHTNKLSGVDLSSDVMSVVAKTMNSAKSITGEKSCSTVLAAFGSLQNIANNIQETIAAVEEVEAFIKDIPNQIAALPAKLENYANNVTQQIVADVGVLAEARLVLLQNSISQSLVSLVDDECLSAVMGGIMSQPLKDEVSKVTSELASKKLISFVK
jgi:hypothetical protein